MLASWIYLSLMEKSDCGLFLANGAFYLIYFIVFNVPVFMCSTLGSLN